MNAAKCEALEAMSRFQHDEADRRKVLVAYTESTMHLIVQLKREIATLTIGMNHSGHGCACDAAHTCAAHAEAQNKLREAYNAMEIAVTSLFKVVQENKR